MITYVEGEPIYIISVIYRILNRNSWYKLDLNHQALRSHPSKCFWRNLTVHTSDARDTLPVLFPSYYI